MSEPRLPETLGSKLLQQDKSLHSERYKEHRMQLELQLIQAESRAKLAKRVVVYAFVVAAAMLPIVLSRLFGGADPYDKDATVFSVAAGGIYIVASSVFWGVVVSRWRPGHRPA